MTHFIVYLTFLWLAKPNTEQHQSSQEIPKKKIILISEGGYACVGTQKHPRRPLFQGARRLVKLSFCHAWSATLRETLRPILMRLRGRLINGIALEITNCTFHKPNSSKSKASNPFNDKTTDEKKENKS